MPADYIDHEFSTPFADAPVPVPSRARFSPDTPPPAGVTVTLADGKTLELRPVAKTDATALQRCFARLPADVVDRRFLHAMAALPRALALQMCEADAARMTLLVLVDRDVEPHEIRAIGRTFVDETTNGAEFSILVEDAARGRGLEAILLDRLLADSRRRGLAEVWGYVLTRDEPLLARCAAEGFLRHELPSEPAAVQVILRLGD